MATEKKQRDSELLSTTKQLTQLEKLCRALQTERATLINEIKSLKNVVTAGTEVTQSENLSTPTDVSDLTLVEQSNVVTLNYPVETNENPVNSKKNGPTILLPLSYSTICNQREVQDSSYSGNCTDLSVENSISNDLLQSQENPPLSENATMVALAESPSQDSATIN